MYIGSNVNKGKKKAVTRYLHDGGEKLVWDTSEISTCLTLISKYYSLYNIKIVEQKIDLSIFFSFPVY